MRFVAEDGTVKFEGQAQRSTGTTVTIASLEESGDTISKKDHGVKQIEVIGREDHTVADVARISFILNVLQRKQQFLASDFIRMVWIPTEEDLEALGAVSEAQLKTSAESSQVSETEPSADHVGGILLNPSQAGVAKAMLSEHPFALVHGPCVISFVSP